MTGSVKQKCLYLIVFFIMMSFLNQDVYSKISLKPKEYILSFDHYSTDLNFHIKRPPKPIAWDGSQFIEGGFLISALVPIRHWFNHHVQFDFGTSWGYWISKTDYTYTLSVVPEFRWLLFSQKSAFNSYFTWSAGGASFISSAIFNGYKTHHFFFQDYFGFALQYKRVSVGIKLLHYSQAGLHDGRGFDVPNTVYIEYRL